MFSTAQSPSDGVFKVQLFILWKIKHKLLASEQAAVCLYGHARVKPQSCRCALATATFSDRKARWSGSLFKTRGYFQMERESLSKKSQKWKYIPTCFMQEVRLGNSCGPSWPELRSCVSPHGDRTAGTPPLIILFPMRN